MTKLAVIHIGKCGGITVTKLLEKHKFKYILYHLNGVKFIKDHQYLIIIRNPVERFVSAFNYRKRKEKQPIKNKTKINFKMMKYEKKFLSKYRTVNSLAEDIYDQNGKLKLDFQKDKYFIYHIKQDINFYLKNFLNKCDPKKNIFGVVITSTLKKDMKRLFNINATMHKNSNSGYPTYLSKKGYQNIKKYLKKDYQCIDKLYKLKIITKAQYKILSK